MSHLQQNLYHIDIMCKRAQPSEDEEVVTDRHFYLQVRLLN